MESILNVSHSIFWFLLIISVIVFIHEFGHYIVARLNGVRVEIFSIGFGKELFGWNDSHGTRWKISALPLGGYVKMFGDADPSSSPDLKKLEDMSAQERHESFYFKSLWRKAAIVIAGPAANYILAIAIFALMFWMYGKPSTLPEISQVQKGSAAAEAGLKTGDMILEIDEERVDTFEDVRQIVSLNTGTPLIILVDRNGNFKEISVTPKMHKTKDAFGNDIEMPMLGIASNKLSHVKLTPLNAITAAAEESIDMSLAMLKAVGQIITGQRSAEQLGGPIKIAQYSGQSASLGLNGILWFIAIISLNLGLINLFPIPMLDGGHLLYYMIEALTGKPLAEKFQVLGFKFGLAFLLLLMIFVTLNDIRGLFTS